MADGERRRHRSVAEEGDSERDADDAVDDEVVPIAAAAADGDDSKVDDASLNDHHRRRPRPPHLADASAASDPLQLDYFAPAVPAVESSPEPS